MLSWRANQWLSTMLSGEPLWTSCFSFSFLFTMSIIAWVRSSSDLIAVSRVMEGLTARGGTGSMVSTIHSGLALFGSRPSSSRSSSLVSSSQLLTLMGFRSLSPSFGS